MGAQFTANPLILSREKELIGQERRILDLKHDARKCTWGFLPLNKKQS